MPTRQNKDKLRSLHSLLAEAEKICAKRPGLWNVVGYERAWATHPDVLDFLNKRSPSHADKAAQTGIYMDILGPYIKKLPRGSRVLDSGGGIGRFAIPLAKRGHHVTIVDASASNIKAATKWAKHNKLQSRMNAQLGDAEDLKDFPDGTFGATLAIELLPYCSDPDKALSELTRVTKKGGLAFISVEAKYGSVIADPSMRLTDFENALKNGRVVRKGDMCTRYWMRDEFETLLRKHGLDILTLTGCHFASDGILGKFGGLGSKELLEIERTCRHDKLLSQLPRTWVAVCKVTKP